MSVYDYIARNNPNLAEGIINSFGYEVLDKSDLGKSLRELVANVGEPALTKIMESHPDRDVILEINKTNLPKIKEPVLEAPKSSCGCNSCKNQTERFFNASGSNDNIIREQNSVNQITQQTNFIMVLSAIIISVALIMNKK